MSVPVRLARAELRAHGARVVAAALAIVLGVGFAAATVVFSGSFSAALGRAAAAEVAAVDLVVQPGSAPIEAAAVAAVPGVALAFPVDRAYPDFRGPESRGWFRMTGLAPEAARWYGLASGVWPTGADDLVVGADTARRNGIAVGSVLTVGGGDVARQMTVVGTVDTGISPLAGAGDVAFAVPATVRAINDDPGSAGYVALDVAVADGVDATTVADRLSAAFPGAEVQTAADIREEAVQRLGNDTDVVAAVLGAFVVLAAFVAAMVVTSTFTILLAARRRQIALLRCVGADRGQLARGFLVEFGVVAVLGAAIGVAGGAGLGRLVCALTGIGATDMRYPVLGLVLCGVVGVIGCLLAAWAPLVRATRVAPLAALRPAEIDGAGRRVSLGRVLLGTGGFLVGGAVLGLGVVVGDLLIAAGGGVVCAVGIVLLLRVVLPGLLRRTSPLARLAGVPGRLALANAVRNPARAAAACTALAIGVGTVTTLLVAATSAQAGADRAVALRYQLDLQVIDSREAAGPLPGDILPAVQQVAGIRTAVAVLGADAELRRADSTPAAGATGDPDSAPIPTPVFAPTLEQYHSVRNGGDLQAGQLAAPAWMVRMLGLTSGDPVVLAVGGREVTLTLADRPVTDDSSVVVFAPDLLSIDPQAGTRAVWAAFAPDAAAQDVVAAVNKLVVSRDGIDVSGAGVERAATEETIGLVIRVAIALVAVAVLIAIVGIGNTVGLSVLERTRESALLRALGLSRLRLRLTVVVEAVLLALVAAVVGVVVGLGFGGAAAATAFRQSGEEPAFAVPVIGLLVVVAAALVAGAVSAVLPARRAARATPVEALAEV
ncbi:FtsX-like permease family protein [Nakamurella sp. YIM 132087]|uniref:FtsX-like permease family protein n=1 Tax=Nakamurella alba TaxID=2665158 RepID=A0A7K1FIE8_9ACTN|nr:FtsX-like permease family protein [Nakamurella alba]MTD13846.1 FtsX-like permease family protein [Nakamurella alba]